MYGCEGVLGRVWGCEGVGMLGCRDVRVCGCEGVGM